MRRRAFLAGLGTAVTGALAGCSAGIDRDTVSESFSRDYEVSGETVVAVENRNGDVTVDRATGDRLVVEGEKRAGSQDGLDAIAVDVTEGEQFLVDARLGSGSTFSSRSVDLTVEVPQGITVDGASTNNGDVTVEDVRGDLRAVTTNGDVEVTDVDGYVRCESSNGSVETRGTTGLTGARTSNGEVDVELLAMRDDVTCRSSNGNVTVRVGSDVSAGVSLGTGNGRVDVGDLPFTATTDRQRLVEGQLRGGESPVLTAESNNGNVRLRPA